MSMKRSGKKGLRTFWAAFAAAVAVAAAGTARAEVKAFPACPWRETKVVRDAKGLRVVDAAGRGVLQFRAEGGDYVRHVVVSQAVDHLVIDARAAFKAGMRKLIISSSGFDPKPYRGQDCTLVTEVSGVRGTKCGAFFEGNAPGLHYYRKRSFETSGIRRQYALAAPVAAEVDSLHLRWDIDRASGPVAFYGARYALESELPSCAEKKKVVPELLFHAPFDGTPDAAFAKGAKAPLRASGLEYAEGRVGKAVRLTARAKSDLAYAAKDNLVPERGTVTFWFKREWPDRGRDAKGGAIWRTLFANERAKGAEKGSGRLWFWWWGDSLRADQGDAEDQYTMRRVPAATADDWNLVAMTWDEERVRIYVNDEERLGDSASPMREALKPRDLLTFTRQAFSTFSVGGEGGGRACDGLVDDLRIYSAPLTPGQVRALWRQAQEVALTLRGRYAEEGTPATLSVSATSPRGLDLSAFRYCLYDAAGKVARRFDGAAVGPKAAALSLAGLPADYRWRGSYPTPDVRARQRTLDETAGFYANLKGAAFPIVHQHDRYWESPIGATAGAGNTLTCDWLKECRWRVSTINPSGRNALRHFVEPLRFVDVLGVSKGGFLIGTYGMEGELVPFLQAFRALPAVVMQDVAAVGDVRVRQGAFDGQSYFYVVNTGLKPARVTLDFPPKTRNLVTGEVFTGKFFGLKGETRTLDLAPYELRSFAAPKGGPRVAESEGGRDRASR